MPNADCRMPIPKCRMPNADCRFPNADSQMPIPKCRMPNADYLSLSKCRMPIAECRLPLLFSLLFARWPTLCSLTFPNSWLFAFFLSPNLLVFKLVDFQVCRFHEEGYMELYTFDSSTFFLTPRLQIPCTPPHGFVHFLRRRRLSTDFWPIPKSQFPIAECRMPIALDSLTLTRPTSPNLSISSWLFHRWLLQLFHPVSSRRQQSHHFHQRLSSGFGVWELNDEEFKVVGWRRRPSQSQEDLAFGIRQSAFGIRQSVKRQKKSWRRRVNEHSRQLEKQSGRWMSNFEVRSQSPKFSSSISDFCIFPQKRTFWVHELTSSKKSLSTHWLPAAKLLVIDDWLLHSARQLGKPWLSQLSKLGIRTQDFFTDLQTSVKSVSL